MQQRALYSVTHEVDVSLILNVYMNGRRSISVVFLMYF